MKKQIRRGIFETNSSSVHAISVSGDKVNPEEIFFSAYFKFSLGCFGWEHRIYFDLEDKASYLWTAIVHNFLKFKQDPTDYTWVLHTEDPEYISIKKSILDALKLLIDEDDLKTIMFQECPGEHDDWGYIDHYPGLEFIHDLVDNPDRLLRFLFSPDSRICTWNDNTGYDMSLPGMKCENPEYVFIKDN